MKKIILLLLLIPFIGLGQINTFPWTHDFDNGVGLTNWTADDGDWLIWSGSTYSNNTGPSDDMTGGGNYWYVEASSPNFPDMYFVSQTDTFDISQTPGQILSFWYHMYSGYTGMGDLNIWIADNNGWNKIDSIQGNQGNEWNLKYIDLDGLGIVGNFTIAFEGITGSWWDSDIAIDDIYIGDSYPIGCMDVTALNYDPNATVDDGSCAYPPCGGFAGYNAYQMCWGNQSAIQFEWLGDTTYSQCDVIEIHVGDENGWSFTYPGYWPAQNGWHGHAVAVGNGQMPPNWNVEHYAVLELADGSLSDTIFYTPTSCIPGCTDSTSISYNPWATIDDGSCGGTTCDPATEQQVTMTIRLDNWPQETGWEMVTNAGPNVQTPSGTYTYNDIGVTYTYNFCVSATAGFEFILTDTYGDGSMGNGQPGAAGEVVIYDCNGDTITYLTSGTWLDGNQNPVGVNFGTVAYSTPQNGVACAGQDTVLGCTNPIYQEYDPLANIEDSSCVNLHVYGCIDDTMFNYNPSATIMDIIPTCNYTLWIGDGAADGWGNSYLGVVQGGNIIGTFTMGPGSYSQTFPLTLDTDVEVEVYYFEIPNAQNPDPQQTTFQTMQNSFKLINADGVVLMHEGGNPFANNGQGALQGFGPPFWIVYDDMPFCGDYCESIVLGCTDQAAYNYNNLANVEDSTCAYAPGCTNSSYLEYYTQGFTADYDDGTCLTLAVWGCIDSTAFNFEPLANISNGGCIPVVLGCMQPLAFNYNPNANTPDTCIPVIYGCTSPIAFNYDSLANTDDGSCEGVVYGCTDTVAFNWNPNANADDGSCVPVIYGCINPTMFNYCDTCNTNDGSCIEILYGCIDSTMFNYNPLANVDNNSCIPFIYGCTDPSMLNYNSQANTEDFSCIPFIYGCTDSTALNYDSLANTDNGSCIAVFQGCMDPNAWNYNPLANINHGHDSLGCLYAATWCINGSGNPFFLNDPCYAWVISVDDYCCENEWDSICQLTYDYCDSSWVGPIPTRITLEEVLMVYPNPTSDKLNINKNVDINVYNYIGDMVISKQNVNFLDLSKLSAGVYMLEMQYKNKLITKQIIKK